MTIWLDNHLSPALAKWIESEFGEGCSQVRDLGLARASDPEIFSRAKEAARILITKDRDFAELVTRLGPPPAIVLLAVGNTSTAFVREKLGAQLRQALSLIEAGEPIVEIS
jgi:predicted nuclease of predicted toxin-antitoxin system